MYAIQPTHIAGGPHCRAGPVESRCLLPASFHAHKRVCCQRRYTASALGNEQDNQTMDSLESLTAKTAEDEAQSEPASTKGPSPVASQKEVNKFASTFAPRASGSTGKPNPAFKGSWLYTVFDVQAWLALVVGGLLSFNVIFPSDEPDIARLMGMWSIWMFTIPSLRARECSQNEKNALNLLFLLVPLANVLLPFVWKNFGFIYGCDVALLFGVFAWKGYWVEDEQ
jgi:hypothetical protein